MTDPFESSKFSIAWAKNHISDLDREVQTFIQDKNTCATVSERNADGTYDLLKLRVSKPMPQCVRGHTSDAVLSLRAALDQAMFGLSGQFLYYPIRNDEASFNAQMASVAKILPNGICEVIRTSKPYKGGNDLFWVLNKLSNTNKHGIIHPMGFANHGMQMSGTHRGRPARFPFPPRWDSVKNEVVLAEIPVTDGECKVDIELSFFIAFDNIEFIAGKEVISTLNRFADMVESVITALAMESKRIGLF